MRKEDLILRKLGKLDKMAKEVAKIDGLSKEVAKIGGIEKKLGLMSKEVSKIDGLAKEVAKINATVDQLAIHAVGVDEKLATFATRDELHEVEGRITTTLDAHTKLLENLNIERLASVNRFERIERHVGLV